MLVLSIFVSHESPTSKALLQSTTRRTQKPKSCDLIKRGRAIVFRPLAALRLIKFDLRIRNIHHLPSVGCWCCASQQHSGHFGHLLTQHDKVCGLQDEPSNSPTTLEFAGLLLQVSVLAFTPKPECCGRGLKVSWPRMSLCFPGRHASQSSDVCRTSFVVHTFSRQGCAQYDKQLLHCFVLLTDHRHAMRQVSG